MSKSTAIMAYMPGTIAEAKDLARSLSGANLLGRVYQQSAPNVLVTIMHGAALGMSPAQALANMHVIEGRPTLSADAMRGICVANKDVCEYFRVLETSATIATMETKRVGDPPVGLSFTIDQAKRAGLAGRGNWSKYPDAMLRARCGSGLARMVYPDLLAGIYDPDELVRDHQPPPQQRGTVTVEQVEPARDQRSPEPEDEQKAAVEAKLACAADELIAYVQGIDNMPHFKTWVQKHAAEVRALGSIQQKRVGDACRVRDGELRAEWQAKKDAERVAAEEHYSPAPVSADTVTAGDLDPGPLPDASEPEPESPSDAFARLTASLKGLGTVVDLDAWKTDHMAETEALPKELGDSVIEMFHAAMRDTDLPF